MNFPNWAKILWWMFLIILLSTLIFVRSGAILSGEPSTIDILTFLFLFGLLLSPIFKEINLFGIQLKQEIRELSQDVTKEISQFKSDIQTSIAMSTNISPHFYLGRYDQPLQDAALADLEEKVQTILNNTLRSYGIEELVQQEPILETPIDAQYLFQIRYTLEIELRSLWESYFGDIETRRPIPTIRIINSLVKAEMLDPDLAFVFREVYSICSASIHGEEVSEEQVGFVRRHSQELLTSLRAIG